MWSDPDPEPANTGFTLSARGAGYMFGIDVIDRFLHENGMTKILRAH
jgi:serine/threonine-protein phosphatase PPG1